MTLTLGHAKAEVRRLSRAGRWEEALALAEHAASHVPPDGELRLAIADALAAGGFRDDATRVLERAALDDLRTGRPLRAIAACASLRGLGRDPGPVEAELARTFAAGSPRLARFATRPAPSDPGTPLPTPSGGLASPAELALRAAAQAIRADDSPTAEQVHPIPFLSELGADAFGAVVRSMTVERLGDGELAMQKGERGDALFLVATGELRVFNASGGTDGTELARLHENTLFGEMSLITGQPRTASVAATGAADLLRVSRDAIARAVKEVPSVAEVLDRFGRERLLRNLLATSPLFTPFSRAQQADLLRRFEGHDIAPGTPIIRQGEPGRGLFVVLSGDLEVVSEGAGAPTVLARLAGGDIFGEMSLVNDQPTTATVRAVAPSSVLYLARSYVERLAHAIPEVRRYFEDIALARARCNTVHFDRVADAAGELELRDDDLLPA